MSQNPNLSFWNLSQSIPTKHFLLLSSPSQKTWHSTPVRLSFCGQNPISRHHVSNSANFKSPCNKVEQKQSLYLGIKSTQHQISLLNGYLGSSPRNNSGYPPITSIPRYQFVILISILIVNNPLRMYKLLSPISYLCMCLVQNILLIEFVLNKSGDLIPISRRIQR